MLPSLSWLYPTLLGGLIHMISLSLMILSKIRSANLSRVGHMALVDSFSILLSYFIIFSSSKIRYWLYLFTGNPVIFKKQPICLVDTKQISALASHDGGRIVLHQADHPKLLIDPLVTYALSGHWVTLILTREDFTFGLVNIFPLKKRRLSLRNIVYSIPLTSK